MRTDMIKLIFHVEYFKPSYADGNFKVDFDLQLLNFGSPCFENNVCKNGGKCTLTKDGTVYNCDDECDERYKGQNCDERDFCLKLLDDNNNPVSLGKILLLMKIYMF